MSLPFIRVLLSAQSNYSQKPRATSFVCNRKCLAGQRAAAIS
jgi:hypothetical protein